MTWAVPQFSKRRVDAAGQTLIDDRASADDYENALTVINNWRSSHSFPLNTFQNGLRRRARALDEASIIAQRIKRLSSIEEKIKRFKGQRLSQLQDIGGCRAVVESVDFVRSLVEQYKKSDLKHKLHVIDNYIDAPKDTDYRGVHLIYKYFSDKNESYNSLKIEVQLRSPYQHAWATAVETVGTFIRQALKSSKGEADWLRFFALMGSAVAMLEETPTVPNTPTNKKELIAELRRYAGRLDVKKRLEVYGATLNILDEAAVANDHYFLLKLDAAANETTLTSYKYNELERASQAYLGVEREIANKAGSEAVLVSVDSLAQLRRAYPNYFLDTKVFVGLMDLVVGT